MNVINQVALSAGVPNAIVATFIFAYGLILGSFANVLISRIPVNHSLMTRSRCPNCKATISAVHNVPIMSFVFLRGKCASCAVKISPRYPLIEFITGLLILVAAIFTNNYFQFALWLNFSVVGISLIVIDLELQRLPDKLTAELFISSLSILAFESLYNQSWHNFVIAIYSALGLTIFYILVYLLSRGGMGFGDVKLAPSIGLVTGYFSATTTFASSMIAFFIGASLGLAMIVLGKATRKTGLPFGPFMIIGAALGPAAMSVINNLLSLN